MTAQKLLEEPEMIETLVEPNTKNTGNNGDNGGPHNAMSHPLLIYSNTKDIRLV